MTAFRIARADLGALQLRRTLVRTRYVFLIIGLLVATCILTWPMFPEIDSTILGQGGDIPESIRLLWALHAQHSTIFTAARDLFVNAPDGTPNLRAVAVASPLFYGPLWIFGLLFGWVAAFNLFGAVVFVLSGVAMFVLLERLRFTWLAALFGAYVFTFNPDHVEKLFGSAPLAATGVIPLVLLALFAKRENPTVRRSLLAGAAIVLAFLFDPYLGLFGVWTAFIFAIVEMLDRDRATSRFALLRSWYFVALVLVIGITPTAFAWWKTGSGTVALAAARSAPLVGGSAQIESYLLPGPRNPWLGGPMSRWLTTHLSWEPSLFIGYTTMLLAAAAVFVALVRFRRGTLGASERFFVLFAFALTVSSFWASLPPMVHIFGVGLPTPQWFIRHVTTVYRVYARFGVLAGFGVILLAAYALSAIPRRGFATIVSVAAIVLVAFELANGLPGKTTVERALNPATVRQLATFESGQPKMLAANTLVPYVRWLRDHPGGVVADYPDPGSPDGRWAWRDLYHQYLDHHPLWQLGPTDTDSQGIRGTAGDLTSSTTPAILATEHVKYVVVHRNRYPILDRPVPKPAAGLKLVARFKDVSIFKVTAPGNSLWSAVGGLDSVYNGALWPERVGYRWFGTQASLEIHSPCSGQVFMQALGVSLDSTRVLHIYDPSGHEVGTQTVNPSVTWFRIPIPVSKGLNSFSLVADPGPQPRGSGDPRPVSIALQGLISMPIPTPADGVLPCS